jgi:hypothetical protein
MKSLLHKLTLIFAVCLFLSAPLSADIPAGLHAGAMWGTLSNVDSAGNALVRTAVYLAPCDGEVGWYGTGSSSSTITGYIGAANPPTTAVAHFHPTGVVADARSFHVPSGAYFQIDATIAPTNIWWRASVSTAGNPVKQ